jgi:UDP-N-acetylglucosamine 2-epimerase
MVGATCAFYRRIRIAHVEAGLRTFDKWSPFPEEFNRTAISQVADLHFAPTRYGAEHLFRAGAAVGSVFVTGNTVIDALLWISRNLSEDPPPELGAEFRSLSTAKRLLLVTSHRRESFGIGLANICDAIRSIADRYRDVLIAYPVHLNPCVREPVLRRLGGHERIVLLPPVGYVELVWLLKHCYLVLTDSGGLQEEAPTFGKPVLILRETTERAEAIEAGCARLVGTRQEDIVAAACELLDDCVSHRAMACVSNPFGDGRAASRIVDVLAQCAARGDDKVAAIDA